MLDIKGLLKDLMSLCESRSMKKRLAFDDNGAALNFFSSFFELFPLILIGY